VGNVFSLHAKIILSKMKDLLRNAIKNPTKTAIDDLIKCHLKDSKWERKGCLVSII